jgi:hypothetical protein
MGGCRGTRSAYSGDQRLEEHSTRWEQMAGHSKGRSRTLQKKKTKKKKSEKEKKKSMLRVLLVL